MPDRRWNARAALKAQLLRFDLYLYGAPGEPSEPSASDLLAPPQAAFYIPGAWDAWNRWNSMRGRIEARRRRVCEDCGAGFVTDANRGVRIRRCSDCLRERRRRAAARPQREG